MSNNSFYIRAKNIPKGIHSNANFPRKTLRSKTVIGRPHTAGDHYHRRPRIISCQLGSSCHWLFVSLALIVAGDTHTRAHFESNLNCRRLANRQPFRAVSRFRGIRGMSALAFPGTVVPYPVRADPRDVVPGAFRGLVWTIEFWSVLGC